MRAIAALAAVLALASCGGGDSGPDAPPVGATAVACAADFCVEYPSTWMVEEGETYLAFSHPLDPDRVLASAGPVDMAALVEAAGGTWPAPAEDAVAAFWSLIGGGDAAVDEIVTAGDGVRSEGRIESLRMWYLLVPTGGGDAIGLEVRAPNRSWQGHAEVFRSGLDISP
jgi:hypothetical protein